jgi:hypothetical protein
MYLKQINGFVATNVKARDACNPLTNSILKAYLKHKYHCGFSRHFQLFAIKISRDQLLQNKKDVK